MELNDNDKKTFISKLAEFIGFTKEVKLAEYKAKDGSTISVNDETKEVKDLADGEYELEDGKVMTVKDGKVESIADAPTEEVAAEEVTVDSAELDALKAENEALKAELEKLKAEKETALTEKTELATQLSEIKNKPADKKANTTLSTQHNSLTPAQLAWQRYNA